MKSANVTKDIDSRSKIDVDSMSLKDLLKQYKKEKNHISDDAVDNKLFEEWKISKRKQFKQGTRNSFVAAYNAYEDMFSTNTFHSAKSTSKDKHTHNETVNPLLSSTRDAPSTSHQIADGSMDSAAHAMMLFSQSSSKNLLDPKNRKNLQPKCIITSSQK